MFYIIDPRCAVTLFHVTTSHDSYWTFSRRSCSVFDGQKTEVNSHPLPYCFDLAFLWPDGKWSISNVLNQEANQGNNT
jgi:hypothetical protein